MIIDLAKVGTTAKQVELEFDPADFDLEGELVTLTGDTVFVGETQRVDDRATVRGKISTDVSLDCTRCLEPIATHLDIPFRAIFVGQPGEERDLEREIGDDKLDESVVGDGRIEMVEVVREQLLLALPEQIFCREDCKGLCPKCGANLNLIDCNCADDEEDPRWAALKNLR